MPTKNAIRVQRFKTLKGNKTYKEKYEVLRFKYGIKAVESNKMKFWAVDRILDYLNENNIKPLKDLKEADRL